TDVARNFRSDWSMLWKEILAGFAISGFVALLPMSFFNGLFLTDAPSGLRLAENVVVGPLVAILSFVCSVGNIPLVAVLCAAGLLVLARREAGATTAGCARHGHAAERSAA